MKINPRLISWLGAGGVAIAAGFIAQNEAVVLQTYKDPVGIYTACAGETDFVATPGDIKPGATFTPAQCQDALYRSMWTHAEPVIRCTAPANLTQGQKIAFLDFSFNVGGAAFCKSTMARLAKAGDVLGSCKEFFKWRMAGGRDCSLPENRKTCGGIWTRRKDEFEYCTGGTP